MPKLRKITDGAQLKQDRPIPASVPLVLYVEDNPANWEIASLSLRSECELLWARGDREAAELFIEHHQRLTAILMDIELKGSTLDGIQLTRIFRGTTQEQHFPEFASTLPLARVPTIFVTAYGARYGEPELKSAGALCMVTKPVDFRKVSAILHSLAFEPIASPAAQLVIAAARGGVSAGALLDRAGADLEARATGLLGSEFFYAPDGSKPRDLRVEAIQGMATVFAVADLIPDAPALRPVLAACLRRAVIAELLATESAPERSVESLALGMLLESGIAVLASRDSDEAERAMAVPSAARCLCERALGGPPHTVRSAEVARSWGLSGQVIAAIRGHHEDAASDEWLSEVAWATERLAAIFEPGEAAAIKASASLEARNLRISTRRTASLLSEVPARTARLAAALGREIGPQRSLDSLLAASTKERGREEIGVLEDTVRALMTRGEALASRLANANARLSQLRSIDGLTGLANRPAFEEALEKDLARADVGGGFLGVILIDVDRFTEINAHHGRLAGDAVLQKLALLLSSIAGEDSLLARFGGAQFVLLQSSDVEAEPAARAQRTMDFGEVVRTRVDAESFEDIAAGLDVTVSLGVVTVKGPGCKDARDDVLRRADEALFSAKLLGRNRVV